MSQRNEPQGLDRFAKFDPSIVRTHQAHFVRKTSWRDVYIRLVVRGDFEAAEIARKLNEGLK